jgi:hypothetical protein
VCIGNLLAGPALGAITIVTLTALRLFLHTGAFVLLTIFFARICVYVMLKAQSLPRILRSLTMDVQVPLAARFHDAIRAFAKDIVVPSMGDSITEGSIAAVMKNANDPVDEDEPVLQIETDKVRPLPL